MPKLRITYTDDAQKDDLVSIGAYAQIAAKRRFGLDALKVGDDPEVILFGVFVELNGPAVAKDPEAFDMWLMTVQSFELEPEPTDPQTAETTPTDSSPGSPPTLD